jgi:hypothetical protein
MKKTYFITLILGFCLSLSLFSCKKDDEVESPLISSLSTSKANYESATAGSWVTITEAEYNNLATKLSNVTVSGMPQANFSGWDTFWWSDNHTTSLVGSGVTKVPSGSYIFAFKFTRSDNYTSTNSKVKLSQTSESTGFSDIGGVLPEASGTSSSVHYYVLKENNTATTATNSYVGFSCKSRVLAASIGKVANVGTNWATGDTGTLNGAGNDNEVYFQSLSTTTKQW